MLKIDSSKNKLQTLDNKLMILITDYQIDMMNN